MTKTPSTPIRVVCPNCGSDDVRRDAYAAWSEDRQCWELDSVYDHGFCNACESDGVHLEDDPIGPQEREIAAASECGEVAVAIWRKSDRDLTAALLAVAATDYGQTWKDEVADALTILAGAAVLQREGQTGSLAAALLDPR